MNSNTQLVVGLPRFPFYMNAFRVLSDLDKSFPKQYPDIGLHSIGSFPKINFFYVSPEGDGPAEYVLQAAVAGFKPEEIDIEINHKDRTIRFSDKPRNTNKEGNDYNPRFDVLVNEIKRSTFNRIITAPDDADLEGIKCTHSDGIIEMVIPIMNKAPHVTKLAIEAK